ncbi:hypothetical protein [Candidatus Nitrosacidococcus sp. I8]|uniref:hypothetical protein n=1 Tax=Candidatus Nitrosacidococcus sp. I8 TaxID=2942908 RepID=UPI002227291E|nr:hypothetical protein [Candidatus Nitrosacidococcus sp. I8]CAH9018051.1 hypothetical protein NURINAE_00698 [Candidatus Nitrosacidococcus sp. I8]
MMKKMLFLGLVLVTTNAVGQSLTTYNLYRVGYPYAGGYPSEEIIYQGPEVVEVIPSAPIYGNPYNPYYAENPYMGYPAPGVVEVIPSVPIYGNPYYAGNPYMGYPAPGVVVEVVPVMPVPPVGGFAEFGGPGGWFGFGW